MSRDLSMWPLWDWRCLTFSLVESYQSMRLGQPASCRVSCLRNFRSEADHGVGAACANDRSDVLASGPGTHPVGPLLADSCLSHCNIVLQWSDSVQKAANGKNRPEGVVENFERECLLLNRTADPRRSGREALASIDLKDSFDFNGEVER
jgi:hypothetical protein